MSTTGWATRKMVDVSPDLFAARNVYKWGAERATVGERAALGAAWERAVRHACTMRRCSEPGEGAQRVDRETMYDAPGFREWLRMRDLRTLTLDLEWDPADDNKLLAVGWWDSFRDTRAWCSAPRMVPQHVWNASRWVPIIEFTNADARVLLEHGYEIRGDVYDLQTMAWTLDENQKLNLESVVYRYLREPMDKRLVRRGNEVFFRCDNGKVVPIRDAPRAQLYRYCRDDVAKSRELFVELVERLKRKGMLDYYLNEELPFTRVLVDMEMAGLPIDLEASEELRAEVEADHTRLEGELREMVNLPDEFNIDSDDQVSAFLFHEWYTLPAKIPRAEFDEHGLPDNVDPDTVESIGRVWVHARASFPGLGLKKGEFTDKCKEDALAKAGGTICGHTDWDHKASTSKTALRMNPATAEHPWVLKYLEWQKLHKLLTTYLRSFLERAAKDGRIHSHYNQTGTRTGRLSSSDMNLQNIPVRGELGKRVRGLFVAPEETPFIIGDFSQLELRLLAHFSEDERLTRYFIEGIDPFIGLASEIYGMEVEADSDERKIMKNNVYALNYGAYPEKIAEMLTMEGFPTSIDQATEYYDDLQDLIPGVFDWRDATIEEAHEKGYVTTIGGRRRNLKRALNSPEWKIAAKGERAGANAKIQGSAADIVRRVMVRFVVPELRLLSQVHDELIYQYLKWLSEKHRREHVAALKAMGENGHGFELRVPLVFEPKVTTSWGEK